MLKILIDHKKSRVISILIAYGLSIIIASSVYLTGGTAKVYANLMYVPIAYIASNRGKKIAMIHALFSGLLVGPLMPLNVSLGIGQETKNWVIRIIIYQIIAFIIGFFYDYEEKSKEYITNILTHDSITGLKNMETLQNEDMPKINNRAIISLSIKGYEQTNRLFGYQFSKDFIIKVSQLLEEGISRHHNMDLIRYAGMEFVIIINESLEGLSDDEVIKMLNFLNNRVIVVANIPIYIETLIGYTSINVDTSTEEGIRQSLIALRYAILNNLKIVEYKTRIDIYYKNMVDVAANFREALGNKNIKAAVQEIYDAKTEEVAGVEMLARWVKDDMTRVPPILFIPIIEGTELINDLTKFMVDQAVCYLKSNENSIASINFSPKNFNSYNVDYLLNIVNEIKIDSRRIRIEITEEILFHKAAFKYLDILNEAGFSIAMDDFGSGYSSYKMLLDLPLDYVKIDKSIIFGITKDWASRTLVESIVYFCQHNNIKTVAEGVETKEIADECRELGINYLQGYYYHKPEIIE